MLDKQANPLTFLALFIASKVGATGLTVTVDVWEILQDGTATEIVTAGSATEVGDGLYRYILASGSVDANAEYICIFKTANTSVDQQHLAAVYSVGRAGVANLDAAVSSRATAAALATAQADLDNIQTRLPAALLDGLLPVDVLSISTDPDAAFALQQYVGNLQYVPDINNNTAAILDDTGTSGVVVAAGSKSGYSLSAAGVQAIWDALTSALTTAGSIGKFLVDNVGSGGATAAEIWDYLTANILTAGSIGKLIKDKLGLITTATELSVDSPVNAGMLTITKAVSLDSGLLDATVPAGWTKCYVTGKTDKDDPDAQALFQIVVSNPGAAGDGLRYLNGAAATANQGSVTVDAGNNQVSFTLADNATAQLPRGKNGYWDIKFLKDDGESTRPVAGLLQIVLPVTLTI